MCLKTGYKATWCKGLKKKILQCPKLANVKWMSSNPENGNSSSLVRKLAHGIRGLKGKIKEAELIRLLNVNQCPLNTLGDGICIFTGDVLMFSKASLLINRIEELL